jgi:hypothetical protein
MLDIGAAKIESGRIESARPAPPSLRLEDRPHRVTWPNRPIRRSAQTIQAAWRSCEWLAIGVETDRGIVLEGVAHYSAAGLSEGAQGLIRSMSGRRPEILRLVPGDAFVVLACRQPFGSLLRQALTGHAKQPAVGAPAEWETFRQVSRGAPLGPRSRRRRFAVVPRKLRRLPSPPRQGGQAGRTSPSRASWLPSCPSTESSGAPRGPRFDFVATPGHRPATRSTTR